MTLELFNTITSLSRKYSREFFRKALELAQAYGWKPLGTRLPTVDRFRGHGATWLGSYLTNDGQLVLTEDALSLAEALSKALDDIPDESREMDWNPKFWAEDELPEWLSPEEKEMIEEGLEQHAPEEMHPFEFFAGDEKAHLKELIRFCRLGSFMIL